MYMYQLLFFEIWVSKTWQGMVMGKEHEGQENDISLGFKILN